MMEENETLSAEVQELTVKSCIGVFEDYRVIVTRSDLKWSTLDERVLCSALGFLGDGLRGTCLLAGTESSIKSSCPEGGRLRDWVGELANQMGGKLKAQFLKRGVKVALATPIVLSGIQVSPLTDGASKSPTVLRSSIELPSAPGMIMVWAEVESAKGFELGPEIELPQQDDDILLF